MSQIKNHSGNQKIFYLSENKTHQNWWDMAKTMLRGSFTTSNTYF